MWIQSVIQIRYLLFYLFLVFTLQTVYRTCGSPLKCEKTLPLQPLLAINKVTLVVDLIDFWDWFMTDLYFDHCGRHRTVLNGWCLSNWVRSPTYYWCCYQDSTNVILVALVKTVLIFMHNCPHVYSTPTHKVRYLHYSGAHVRLVPIVPTMCQYYKYVVKSMTQVPKKRSVMCITRWALQAEGLDWYTQRKEQDRLWWSSQKSRKLRSLISPLKQADENWPSVHESLPWVAVNLLSHVHTCNWEWVVPVPWRSPRGPYN